MELPVFAFFGPQVPRRYAAITIWARSSQSITVLCSLPNYTACGQKHMSVKNLPRVVTW